MTDPEHRPPCPCCGARYTHWSNPFQAIHAESCTDPLRHWGYCGDADCVGPCEHCGACTHGVAYDDGAAGVYERTCTQCYAHYWSDP